MTKPWLSLIGIGEDGLDGLSVASRAALRRAEIVFGGERHLRLSEAESRGRPWPLPFSLAPVLACRGERVAVLTSGDPFWFGAGGSIAVHLTAGEWVAYPTPSTFSLAAARLGWRLEETTCVGLHAAPFETLLAHVAPGRRAICLVRDGAAAADLAAWLARKGFGRSRLWIMERLAGPAERIRETDAERYTYADAAAPLAVAVLFAGSGGLPRTSGLPDDMFRHDGQITKRPVRALTLSALAPCTGEVLWDIGAGSGSISLEWCLAGGRAVAVETRSDRAANVRANAAAFGVLQQLTVIEGTAPAALTGLPPPDAIFLGGGANPALLAALWEALPARGRLVANAVTLPTEQLLLDAYSRHGGGLLRIELATATPLGASSGWAPSRPLVQWSVTKCG